LVLDLTPVSFNYGNLWYWRKAKNKFYQGNSAGASQLKMKHNLSNPTDDLHIVATKSSPQTDFAQMSITPHLLVKGRKKIKEYLV
jgi:hypothetical protein